jgi:hypothetical protein
MIRLLAALGLAREVATPSPQILQTQIRRPG